jgi:hypothetical protein
MQTATQREKPTLPELLDTKLNRHFLACSAFVGTAVLMSGQRAEAGIVYSGVQNLSIPTTNGAGGIYLDLTLPGQFFIPTASGSGVAEGLNTLLPGWDVNFYRSGGGNLRWYYPKVGGNATTLAVFTPSVNTVTALSAGATIDGSSSLGTYQALVPQFVGTTAFMGVEFKNPSNNNLFGWIRINGGPTQGFPATIVDWAYESSGAGIVAGAVPEPSSLALGCLAAGAAGVAAWRNRKKS